MCTLFVIQWPINHLHQINIQTYVSCWTHQFVSLNLQNSLLGSLYPVISLGPYPLNGESPSISEANPFQLSQLWFFYRAKGWKIRPKVIRRRRHYERCDDVDRKRTAKWKAATESQLILHQTHTELNGWQSDQRQLPASAALQPVAGREKDEQHQSVPAVQRRCGKWQRVFAGRTGDHHVESPEWPKSELPAEPGSKSKSQSES